MADLTVIACSSTDFSGLSAEILQLGKSLRFQARGHSMQPLVRDGDFLLVKPLGERRPGLGDVVLCVTESDEVLVHRVIRRHLRSDGYHFLVQGDQVAQPDGWIARDQIYGKVEAIKRDGNHISTQSLVMRFLSTVAVLRSRWHFGYSAVSHQLICLIKRVPIFSIFLT